MTEVSEEALEIATELLVAHQNSAFGAIAGSFKLRWRVAAALQQLMDERDHERRKPLARMFFEMESRAEAAEKERDAWERRCKEIKGNGPALLQRAEAAEERVAALEAKCDLLSGSLKQADAKLAEESKLLERARLQRATAEENEKSEWMRVKELETRLAASESLRRMQLNRSVDRGNAAENALHCLIEEVLNWDANTDACDEDLYDIINKYRKAGTPVEHPDTARLRELVREVRELEQEPRMNGPNFSAILRLCNEYDGGVS